MGGDAYARPAAETVPARRNTDLDVSPGTGVLSMSHRILAYVLAVTAAAACASTAVWFVAPPANGAWTTAALYLTALGIIAHLLVFRLPVGGSASIAFIPILAAALLSPNWVCVAAVVTANIVTEIFSRREILKATFNVAQLGLATSLAILIYVGSGGESLLSLGSASWLEVTGTVLGPFVLLVLAFFITNTAAVSGVL